jgi:hypothetical protein
LRVPKKVPLPYRSRDMAQLGKVRLIRYRLRTLLIVLACVVPLNCASFIYLCAAIEAPNLDVNVARGVFGFTVLASLIAMAIPVLITSGGDAKT